MKSGGCPTPGPTRLTFLCKKLEEGVWVLDSYPLPYLQNKARTRLAAEPLLGALTAQADGDYGQIPEVLQSLTI